MLFLFVVNILIFTSLIQGKSVARGPNGLNAKEQDTPITMPPTPPVQTCRNIGGFDLRPILSKQFEWVSPLKSRSGVRFSLCDTLAVCPFYFPILLLFVSFLCDCVSCVNAVSMLGAMR
jgi:hypothetical protein